MGLKKDPLEFLSSYKNKSYPSLWIHQRTYISSRIFLFGVKEYVARFSLHHPWVTRYNFKGCFVLPYFLNRELCWVVTLFIWPVDCVVSLLLRYDLMHLTRGMCGVSPAAMLGRDFMKLTHDCIRLIQYHFSTKNIPCVQFCGLLLDS